MKKRKLENGSVAINGNVGNDSNVSPSALFDRVLSSIAAGDRETQDASFCENAEKLYAELVDHKDDEAYRKRISPLITDSFLTALLCHYNATRHPGDQLVTKILALMERAFSIDLRHLSPLVWGAKAVKNYDDLRKFGTTLHRRLSPDEALEWLDGTLMWRSLLRLGGVEHVDCYDSRFMLRFLASLVESGSDITCKKFIERNGLSYAFSALALEDGRLRGLAYAIIARFSARLGELSTEDFEQRSIFVYLLKVFRNSVETANQRLPTVVAHFLARLSKLILHAEDAVFPSLMAFLVLKPTLELDQVPEFFKLMLSSSTEYHDRERNWMMQLIAESMHSPQDYHVLEKRHGIKLCLSLFASCMADMQTRKLVLTLLKAVALHEASAMHLICQHNIFAWIAFVALRETTSRWELGYLAEIAAMLVEHLQSSLEDKGAHSSRDSTMSKQIATRCGIAIALTIVVKRLNVELDKPQMMWSEQLKKAGERLMQVPVQ